MHVTTTTVTNMGPVSATPGGVKRQVAQIDAVQDEITKQKVNILLVDELADWLCEERKSMTQYCTNVINKVNKIKQPLQELSTRLTDRRTRLQAILVASQDFKDAFDHFIVELDQLEKKQQKNKPISVQWKVSGKDWMGG